MRVIGGSQASGEKCGKTTSRHPLAMGMLDWGSCAVVLIATLLYSGLLGDWFSPGAAGHGWLGMTFQLSAGSAALGALVSVLGHLFVSRHAVLWGVAMPLLAMGLGSVLALLTGQTGALILFLSLPVLSGIAVATGLACAYFVSGISARDIG